MDFEPMHKIDIPLINLRLEGDPFELGYVKFIRMKEDELREWKAKARPPLWPINDQEINVFARVRVSGDPQNEILIDAKQKVEESINILRAFSALFGSRSEIWQVKMLSGNVSMSPIPIRIDERQFAAIRTGFGPADLELRQHILSKLDKTQWESLSRMIQKTEPNPMESKLLNAIQWLGESTKPDTNDAKFAKIAFALEAMIGGEPEGDLLQVRGITAMLAERAAFLLGEDQEARLGIDKKVRKYYHKRSKIVHQGKGDVKLDDLDRFGALVRRLAIALLERSEQLEDELSTVKKLESWVKSQRYALPDKCD